MAGTVEARAAVLIDTGMTTAKCAGATFGRNCHDRRDERTAHDCHTVQTAG